MYSMGSNEFGQLGLNSKVKNRNLPTLVNGKEMEQANGYPKGGITAYNISAGAYHSIAIVNGNWEKISIKEVIWLDGEEIYTWGKNESGQLGNNSLMMSYVPINITE